MLPDNEIEYPPKYSKRDLTKTMASDDANQKSVYHLENSLNETDMNSFSLEMLIDTLIKSSFGTNTESTTNTATVTENTTESETTELVQTTVGENLSLPYLSLTDTNTKVISMNFTDENDSKNKYVDVTNTNQTADLNEVITYLAKQIEAHNNTSLEIARHIVDDFDDKALKLNNEENVSTESYTATFVQDDVSTESTISSTDLNTESTTLEEIQVTQKNRKRVLRKLIGSKIN